MKNETIKTETAPTEQVGRKYSKVRFGLHSRRITGNKDHADFNNWYGTSHYKSLKDAQSALESQGKPLFGGLVEFSGAKDTYEYRIVREVSECEVVHVERRML